MQNEKKKEKILFYPTKNTIQNIKGKSTTKNTVEKMRKSRKEREKTTIPLHLPKTQYRYKGKKGRSNILPHPIPYLLKTHYKI